MFSKKNKIIFFVRYPSGNDLKDGYFQRIISINNILSDFDKYYINYRYNQNNFLLFLDVVKIKEGVFEIRPCVKNPLHLFIILIFSFFAERVYIHSILTLRLRLNRLSFLISKKRILDVHGVVPEEFEMHENYIKSKFFNKIEKFAVKKSTLIIGVTEKMISHLEKKYNSKKQSILLPIMSNRQNCSTIIKKNTEPNSIIYCGGLQEWQQVKKMLAYVNNHKNKYNFTFIVPNPENLNKEYIETYKESFPGIITSSSSNDLSKLYQKNYFGLIFRKDTLVNNVACPTKLIEYLQNNILPIVDSEDIGDFKKLGYNYIYYKENLPSKNEWLRMTEENKTIYYKYKEIFNHGSEKLIKYLITTKKNE